MAGTLPKVFFRSERIVNYYELYGKLSREVNDTTLATCRSNLQKISQQYIVPDIITKLDLTSEDTVLEIGCGLGTILLPLSLVIREIHGIDHPDIVHKLKDRIFSNNCSVHQGNWLSDDFKLPKTITKILIYSVIHYIDTQENVFKFIDKALEILPPAGKMLLGDLPNSDKRERFACTEFGKQFNQQWTKQREIYLDSEEQARDNILVKCNVGKMAEDVVKINDEFIALLTKRYRKMGHEVYLLPQKSYLPFGYTREDLLIVKSY